jgi:hypothetical protein
MVRDALASLALLTMRFSSGVWVPARARCAHLAGTTQNLKLRLQLPREGFDAGTALPLHALGL